MRAIPFAVVLFVTLSHVHPTYGQTPPPTPAPADARELGQPQQTVEVEEDLSDDAIGERLRKILDSTERFANAGVVVRDGVVFLTGMAREEDHRLWAKELALKTRGVVAVVNNITIQESPLWNLAPARQELRRLWRQIIRGTPLFLIGLVMLALSLVAARVVSKGVGKAAARRMRSDILRGIAEKTALILVVLIGVYIFLRVSGLTQVALTVVGGTGIAGLIAGFAFRDIAENFLASLLISVQRPFHIGDTIEVAGQTGVVQKVTTRGTVLIDFEGNYIQISNATIYKSTIRNFTANPNVRIDFTINIPFEQSIERAQDLLLRIVQEHDAVLKDPEPMVLVEQLGAAVALRVFCWVDGHVHSKGKVKSALMRLSVAALQEADILKSTTPATALTAPKQIRGEGKSPSPDSPHEPFSQATRAEGGLRSEVAELDEQAKRSRMPEEGETVLDDSDDSWVDDEASTTSSESRQKPARTP